MVSTMCRSANFASFRNEECEAQNKVSRAKICIGRGDAEAWMIVPCRLVGRLGGDVGSSVGLGNAVG